MTTVRAKRCPFTKLTQRQAMALSATALGDGERNDRLVRTARAFQEGCFDPEVMPTSSAAGVYRSLVSRGLLSLTREYRLTDEGFEALGRCSFFTEKMRAALMARHAMKRRKR